MTPKDYKGKEVRHKPTGKVFLVVGGQIRKKSGSLLKDESGSLYPLSECVLIAPSDAGKIDRLEFDVRKIRGCKTPEALSKMFNVLGKERYEAAWAEIEKDPIEAALLTLPCCTSWKDFNSLLEGYGLKAEQSVELNTEFRNQLKANERLSQMVANWYATREEVA